MIGDRAEDLPRDSTALGVGSVVNGLAAYAFVVLGTRSIGAGEFAPVALLWGFWAFSGASLGFPIQHWVIRQMRIDRHARGVAAAIARLAGLVVVVALGQGLVAWALGDRLFGTRSLFWPSAVIVLAVGTAFLGFVRGLLAGSGRYLAAAVTIGGENLVRVLAAAIALVVWDSPRGFAAALLIGPLIGMIWRRPFKLSDRSGAAPEIRLAGASGVGLVLAQIVLHGGPVMLGVLGAEPADITILFSTLAIFRAPYLIALGLTLRSTGTMTEWVVQRQYRKVIRVSVAIAVSALVVGCVAAIASAAVGPGLVALIFGPETRPSVGIAVAVAGGSVVATAGLWLVVGLISAGREVLLVGSWMAGALAFAAMLLLGVEPAALRVALAFAVGETVALLTMATGLVWWSLGEEALVSSRPDPGKSPPID